HEPPISPVVAAQKDVRLNHEFHVQPVEQALDLPLGVDAHVRRKVVPHEIRYPVGQDRQIAWAVVFPAEKEAMGFKGIQSVWRVHDDVSAWRYNSIGLADRVAIVLDV